MLSLRFDPLGENDYFALKIKTKNYNYLKEVECSENYYKLCFTKIENDTILLNQIFSRIDSLCSLAKDVQTKYKIKSIVSPDRELLDNLEKQIDFLFMFYGYGKRKGAFESSAKLEEVLFEFLKIDLNKYIQEELK